MLCDALGEQIGATAKRPSIVNKKDVFSNNKIFPSVRDTTKARYETGYARNTVSKAGAVYA